MDTTKMPVTSENSYCQHLAEKPEMRVSTVGYYDCHGCEQPLKTGELYFFQRQITLSEPSVFGFTDERWHNKHEYCAKLCRTCGDKKHVAIEFEPFVCRIESKGYRVIEKNPEGKPHLF
jgi:hypothetical protein